MTFSEHQLQDLEHLGVRDQQIVHLSTAINVVWPLIAEVAPMQDVLDRLTGLEVNLSEAFTRTMRLTEASTALLDAGEACDRIAQAALGNGGKASVLQDLLEPLQRALQAVETARSGLHKGQRRGRNAKNWAPIRWIDDALVSGWDEVYPPHAFRMTNLGRHLPVRPRYPFKVAKADQSKFRQVADLCYGAMRGEHAGNAESAIREYLKWSKVQQQTKS